MVGKPTRSGWTGPLRRGGSMVSRSFLEGHYAHHQLPGRLEPHVEGQKCRSVWPTCICFSQTFIVESNFADRTDVLSSFGTYGYTRYRDDNLSMYSRKAATRGSPMDFMRRLERKAKPVYRFEFETSLDSVAILDLTVFKPESLQRRKERT